MAVQAARPNVIGRATAYIAKAPAFYNAVVAEMRKVTWPDRGQIRNATIGIIVFVLFVGAIITLMDVVLQWLLVRVIPSLFT
ncbi:MAG: preprotein translocase subunit SecE [Gemmatimonadaceae bacterium]